MLKAIDCYSRPSTVLWSSRICTPSADVDSKLIASLAKEKKKRKSWSKEDGNCPIFITLLAWRTLNCMISVHFLLEFAVPVQTSPIKSFLWKVFKYPWWHPIKWQTIYEFSFSDSAKQSAAERRLDDNFARLCTANSLILFAKQFIWLPFRRYCTVVSPSPYGRVHKELNVTSRCRIRRRHLQMPATVRAQIIAPTKNVTTNTKNVRLVSPKVR